jgi:hypothetical protein
MTKKVFRGKTVQEVQKKIADWKSAHADVTVKKEFSPVEVRMRSGMSPGIHTPKLTGPPTSVHVTIEYEKSN